MKRILYLLLFLLLLISFLPSYSQEDMGEGGLDLVILIDTSKSVDNLPDVKASISAWLDKVLKPGDRVCIIKFSNKPERSHSFNVSETNLSEIMNCLPVAPDSDGNYTDLSAAVMESLLVLTDYYHKNPDASKDRKQYMLLISDFINDPPPESPYYDQNDTPYLKYEEAMGKCFQSGDKFPILNVELQPFVLVKPLDDLTTEMDEWWTEFLKSLPSEPTPTPTVTPVPEKTPLVESTPYDAELLDKIKSEYEEDRVSLAVEIYCIDNGQIWGEVTHDGITLIKDFELSCQNKKVILKEVTIEVEGFIKKEKSEETIAVPSVKFLESSFEGMDVNENILTLDYLPLEEGEKSNIPLSLEVTIPPTDKFSETPEGKVRGELIFKISAITSPRKEYDGTALTDFGLSEKELEKIFPESNLEDEKNIYFNLLYKSKKDLYFLLAGLGALILLILLIILVLFFARSGKAVSVTLKLAGMTPVIHTYELSSRGSIEITGGSFVTPDQFELPDVEGLAAMVQRSGNNYFLIPEKASIVNEPGEALKVQKKINFGDTFTLRIEKISGGTGDFIFEFQKASLQDWQEEEGLDNILEEEEHIAGKIDTGDLL